MHGRLDYHPALLATLLRRGGWACASSSLTSGVMVAVNMVPGAPGREPGGGGRYTLQCSRRPGSYTGPKAAK